MNATAEPGTRDGLQLRLYRISIDDHAGYLVLNIKEAVSMIRLVERIQDAFPLHDRPEINMRAVKALL